MHKKAGILESLGLVLCIASFHPRPSVQEKAFQDHVKVLDTLRSRDYLMGEVRCDEQHLLGEGLSLEKGFQPVMSTIV